MPYIKNISRLILLAVVLVSTQACFTTNDQGREIALEYIKGEVFVLLEQGATYEDLEKTAKEHEFEIDRPLGNGYIVKVPVDNEPLWITQLKTFLIIDEARYNVYGYEYSISIEEPEPMVDNNELTLTINYSGCDDGHAFQLEHPANFSNDLKVWLFKTTPDQECDAYFASEYTFTIPRFIQLASKVTIEDPFGNEVQLWPDPQTPVVSD